MQYLVKKIFEKQCFVCDGHGHSFARCSTKKRIKRYCLKINCLEEWKALNAELSSQKKDSDRSESS